MTIYNNYSLKKHNTFGIDATAAAFVEIKSINDLEAVLKTNKLPIYLLGGGSNILFTKDFYDVLFIKNAISGIKIVKNGFYTEGSLLELKIQNLELSIADLVKKTKDLQLEIAHLELEISDLKTVKNNTELTLENDSKLIKNKAELINKNELNLIKNKAELISKKDLEFIKKNGELLNKNEGLKAINLELIDKNKALNLINLESNTAHSNNIIVEFGGGESWHDAVLWAVENDLGGIENMSLIPGTIGAAPIQNIGAYGVELKNVFHKLEAVNLQTLENQTFTAEDCQFGYRDSIFKNALKGQYLITKVYLTLTLPKYHRLNVNYGDIQKTLAENGTANPTIRDISNAVIAIRQSKLPDPAVIGNAGSFFKNPEISLPQFNELKNKFPSIVGYPTANNTVKVAAGWLIETAGWKGKRVGSVGVHERQALVLVNYGGGKGLEIKALAENIQTAVFDLFGIELIMEVNWL